MQSKRRSLVETVLNQLSGIAIAFCVWRWIVCPWQNIVHDPLTNMKITLLFFSVSVVRGYVWRRIFNRGESK